MKTFARVVTLVAIAAGVAFVPQGCSLAISNDLGDVHCEGKTADGKSVEGKFGPPVCLRDQICVHAVCRSCVVADVCGNGIDDNCNGLVDEGCGQAVGEDGGGTGDDDDTSMDVLGGGETTPGGAAGADVGAGGSGDDAGGSAPDLGAGRGPLDGGSAGTSGDGGSGPMHGGAGMAAEGGSGGSMVMMMAGAPTTAGAGGAIVTLTQVALGAACDASTSCLAGTCIPFADFDESLTGSVCSKACGASSECGDPSGGAICFPTRSGGGACIAAASVGRPNPGNSDVGVDCSDGASVCRSAYCVDSEFGSVCSDVCNDGGCEDGSQCGATSVDSSLGARSAFVCEVEAGDFGDSDVCGTHSSATNEDCASNLCGLVYSTSDYTSYPRCARTCCSSDDCGTASPSLTEPTFIRSCTYTAQKNEDGTADVHRICGGGAPHDDDQLGAPVGSACTANTDCRSNVCFTTDGDPYCTDACCSDGDCGDSGLKCKPLERQFNFSDQTSLNIWVLRCVR